MLKYFEKLLVTLMIVSGIAVPGYAANSGRIIRILPQRSVVDIERSNGILEGATNGTVMERGDLVYPDGKTVTVQCRNRDGTYIDGSRSSVFGLEDVCPSGIRYDDDGRGENDFLLFLENRFSYASQVSNGTPMLRWNSVEGAASYQIEVWSCGKAVFNCTTMQWTVASENPETIYGGEPLEPERFYELRVFVEETMEPLSTLKLRRLEADQSVSVQATAEELKAAQLGASNFSSEELAMALATVHLIVAEPQTLPPRGSGLVLEAITALENIAPESTTPQVHRRLGDLYLQSGLIDAAEGAYEKVLSLTGFSRDLASRAAAQVGLANIAAVHQEMLLAEQYLERARVNYQLLADEKRAEQVKLWLASLKSKTNR